jgi:hypothetical protein
LRRAWLALEEDWIAQVKELAAKLREDEKLTPEFLALTTSAAEQLRDVANKAQRDAEEAEMIVSAVANAMGNPKLVEEEAPEPAHTTNGKAKTPKAKAPKPKAPKVKKKRIRLAKHPKKVDGKFVGV